MADLSSEVKRDISKLQISKMNFLTRKDLWALSLIVLIVVLLFFKVFFLGFTVLPLNPGWDTSRAASIKILAANSIHAGRAPLWNPYILSGVPLHAGNEVSAFSPMDFLMDVFPGLHAWGLTIVLNILMGGLFTYLYMRKVRIGMLGSLVASMAYMLGPGNLVEWEWRLYVGPYVFLPLVLFCVEMILERRTLVWSLVLGISIGLVILNGVLISSLFICVSCVVYSIFRMTTRAKEFPSLRNTRLRTSILLVVGFIVGVAIGMIQILPTAELTLLSQRVLRGTKYMGINCRHLLSIGLNVVAPNLFGDRLVDGSSYIRFLDISYPYYYIGIIPLVFAALALFKRSSVFSFFKWWLATVLGFLLVLGISPVRNALGSVFPGMFIINPQRLLDLSYLSFMPFLAGFGANLVLRKGSRELHMARRILYILLGMVFISFIFANLILGMVEVKIKSRAMEYILSHPSRYRQSSDYYQAVIDLDYDGFRERLGPTGLALTYPATILLLSTILFGLYVCASGSRRDRLKKAVVLLAIADLLFIASRTVTISSPEKHYPDVDEIQFIARDPEIYRILAVSPPHEETPLIQTDPAEFQRRSFAGASPWTIYSGKDRLAYIQGVGTLTYHKIQTISGDCGLQIKRYVEFMSAIESSKSVVDFSKKGFLRMETFSSPLLNLLNVKYILSQKKLVAPNLRLVYKRDLYVYLNTSFLPRAFFVRKMISVPNENEALAYMKSSRFKPREEIVVEDSVVPVLPKWFGEAGDSKVSIVKYEPETVVIDCDLVSEGFLVLSDNYYPGWQVYVDGRAEKILQVDYILRAVRLQPGKHTVTFTYRPWTFVVGVAITCVTLGAVLLCFVGIAIRSRVRKKR